MAATIPTNGIGLDAGLDVTGGDITFKTASKAHATISKCELARFTDYEEEQFKELEEMGYNVTV